MRYALLYQHPNYRKAHGFSERVFQLSDRVKLQASSKIIAASADFQNGMHFLQVPT